MGETRSMILAWLRAPIAALCLLVAACAAPNAPGIDCDLTRITQMQLRQNQGLLTVGVGINGQWVTMLVDTGAERSLITEETAERLRLPRDPRFVTRAGGVGGVTQSNDARIDSFIMGDVAFPIQRLAVNRLGPGIPFDGLLGADILLAFDLDIDVPNNTLTLYRVRRCAVANPPWTEPAVPIAGVTAQRDRMMVPFHVDGTQGVALLDTGAQTSALGVSWARRLGLTEQTMAGDPPLTIRGVGPGTLQARIHLFREVRIGPVVTPNARLPVLPIDIGFGDALIGQDFLRGRRVWLSFPTRRLFVSQHGHEMLIRP